jgi:hypothetical protein
MVKYRARVISHCQVEDWHRIEGDFTQGVHEDVSTAVQAHPRFPLDFPFAQPLLAFPNRKAHAVFPLTRVINFFLMRAAYLILGA